MTLHNSLRLNHGIMELNGLYIAIRNKKTTPFLDWELLEEVLKIVDFSSWGKKLPNHRQTAKIIKHPGELCVLAMLGMDETIYFDGQYDDL